MTGKTDYPRQPAHIPGYELVFSDDFDGSQLSPDNWLAGHLPHWSSREAARPSYRIAKGTLRLFVAPDQAPWCPEFDGDVRVSALQTGQYSGPLNSDRGQRRFNASVRVREPLADQRLYTPHYGRIGLRARAQMGPGALASLYLIGFEDQPDRSGEITVMEVFAKNCHADRTDVGCGIKQINDPTLETDFREAPLPIRIGDWHQSDIDWTPDGVVFFVDDEEVFRSTQSPDYPMQLMLTFYQLPTGDGAPADPAACFEIDYVRGYQRSAPG